MKQQHWNSEDFERWLALQEIMGWKVRNPEAVEKIRAEFRKGANILAPVRELTGQLVSEAEKQQGADLAQQHGA